MAPGRSESISAASPLHMEQLGRGKKWYTNRVNRTSRGLPLSCLHEHRLKLLREEIGPLMRQRREYVDLYDVDSPMEKLSRSP